MNRSRLSAIAVTLILCGCKSGNGGIATTINEIAVLAGDISSNPLAWKLITSGLNPSESTVSTLFGNDNAVRYTRTGGGVNYPAGSMLSLVTWHQQEDRFWFGARIPAQPKSMEFVRVRDSGACLYKKYEGSPLKETETPPDRAKERAAYILSQRAAVMP